MRFGIIVAAAAAAFSLAACDSKTDQAAEVKADTIENAGEAQADALEAQADKVEEGAGAAGQAGADATAESLEQKADAVEAATDAKADAVEQEAGKSD
jgi:hypothetical protein